MGQPPTQDELLAVLDWSVAMGADQAISDTPVNWLDSAALVPGHGFTWPKQQQAVESPDAIAVKSMAAVASPVARIRPQTPIGLSEAGAEARQIAPGANNLAALRSAIDSFNGCALKATAKSLCFYRGSERAQLMVIGEAPGREEDIEGRPFVGRAGQLLDRMLVAIGFDETNAHLTNVVYWRPPGNRLPTTQEALACRPFLDRQIALVRPDVILALGGTPAKELIGVSDGIMKLRGRWRDLQVADRSIGVMPTLHPEYLLRTPAAKQLVWADLLAVKRRLMDGA